MLEILWTILIFILVFAIIVFIHEFGHFVAAKLFGVKVEEFAFGFPPRIWAKKRGETTYAINILPLGGYVKLLGEDAESNDPRALNQASTLKKSIIMLSGVVMNLLLAWVILMALLFIPTANKGADGVFVFDVTKSSPAAASGLQIGDIILKIDGSPIHKYADLHNVTQNNLSKTVSINFMRFGRPEQKSVTLGTGDTPLGVAADNFSLAQMANPVWWKVPFVALQQIWRVVEANAVFIWGIVGGWLHLTAPVSTDQVSGPVGIYGMVAQFIALGWVYILMILAQLSLAVAIFNVLPIPALDGGRFFLIGLTHLVGRKRLTPAIENAIHTVGFFLLIGLFLLVTWHDIVKLIR